MDRTTLRQTIIDLLESETGTRYDNLADDTVLTEGLGLDSIDLVSLIVQVENRQLAHQTANGRHDRQHRQQKRPAPVANFLEK